MIRSWAELPSSHFVSTGSCRVQELPECSVPLSPFLTFIGALYCSCKRHQGFSSPQSASPEMEVLWMGMLWGSIGSWWGRHWGQELGQVVNGNHFSELMLRLHFRNCKRCEMFQQYQLETISQQLPCSGTRDISSISYCPDRKSWHVTSNPIPGVRTGSRSE